MSAVFGPGAPAAAQTAAVLVIGLAVLTVVMFVAAVSATGRRRKAARRAGLRVLPIAKRR